MPLPHVPSTITTGTRRGCHGTTHAAALAELDASGANGAIIGSAADGARDAIGDFGAAQFAWPEDEMLDDDEVGAADGAAVGIGAAIGAAAADANADSDDEDDDWSRAGGIMESPL